jgi:hypothetical protein
MVATFVKPLLSDLINNTYGVTTTNKNKLYLLKAKEMYAA